MRWLVYSKFSPNSLTLPLTDKYVHVDVRTMFQLFDYNKHNDARKVKNLFSCKLKSEGKLTDWFAGWSTIQSRVASDPRCTFTVPLRDEKYGCGISSFSSSSPSSTCTSSPFTRVSSSSSSSLSLSDPAGKGEAAGGILGAGGSGDEGVSLEDGRGGGGKVK